MFFTIYFLKGITLLALNVLPMSKIYTYENGIIYVSIPDANSHTIRKATEHFFKRIIIENEGASSKWEQ